MQKITDWIKLWEELADAQARRRRHRDGTGDRDHWRQRARGFDQCVKDRWAAGPDSSREFIVAQLKAHPGSTVLDIGAGTGAWTLLMAPHARHVTAVEPSQAMAEVLEENLAAEGVTNVTVVPQAWPDAEVEPHDVALCSHAMYGTADFPGFVDAMQRVTRRTCILLMRAPVKDAVMAEAALRVLGQPYDSTNFQVGYNALLQMGLFPNVLMEDSGLWHPWTNAGLDEALSEVKMRLGLDPEHESEHDAFLADLLHRRLTCEDGRYVWPRGVRSALVYWEPDGGVG